MQHALNRTFRKWKEAGGIGEIDFEHYEAAHTVEGALNDHADELMEELPLAARPWTEKVFRCLTTTLVNGRAVRRPTRFDLLIELLGIQKTDEQSRALVCQVVEKYAQRDNSLLVCSPSGELEADTVVDISHESLIARWAKLKRWVTDEASAASWYRSAAEDAARHARGEAPTWRDPKLSVALTLIHKGQWNQAWAARDFADCGTDFDGVRKFLANGSAEQRKEKLLWRAAWAAIGSLLIGALIALTVLVIKQREIAGLQRRLIASQQQVANLDNKAHAINNSIADVYQQLSASHLSKDQRSDLEKKRDELETELKSLEHQKAQAEKRVDVAAAAVQPDLIASIPKPEPQPLTPSAKVDILKKFVSSVLHENYDSAWSHFTTDYQTKHSQSTWYQHFADLSRQHQGGLKYNISAPSLVTPTSVCTILYRDGSLIKIDFSLTSDGATGAAIADFRISPGPSVP